MIINCSHCSGPILKDVEFEASSTASIKMKLKCPHCQKPAVIEINAVLTPIVKQDGRVIEKIGEDASVAIRTLST